ncbi:hypothetical protein [Pseudomonas phage PA1C]|uniref:Uncharacterized protein n=1 Tax=Pseudomonas phage vB_PaeM_PS119XW TaxID=2601632 RepID=A0A5C1K6S9_9CAUD|nr:hypothetical protein PP933_gp058 [Pseudomonas phage vB_PaeM_PS119XW]QBX32209.1 hypothetical protein [Pseudomonas phage PA1C]QEM41787.1 hypothetical protein [Pseudomonas phage vB_PaeM_PS119XW]BEG72697.1 hypothetical protein RVBP21_3250 [Pseudomonas phage BRkr]
MIEPVSFKADPNKARRPILDSYAQKIQAQKGRMNVVTYCANNPDKMVKIHRDGNKWYCCIERDGVEVIDKNEIIVMGPPGFPDTIQLQISNDPNDKVHFVEIHDGRIWEAINAIGGGYTRKRIELPFGHPFLDFLFVESD